MRHRKAASIWRTWLTVVPAVGLALLPRLVCPCQWPAYAGLAGWLGLAFLLRTEYLLPLTAMCLTLAVGGLAVGARRRHGYGPFAVGLGSAVAMLAGKFIWPGGALLYAGIALLLAASLWNTWPRGRRARLQLNPDGTVSPAEGGDR